MLYNLKTAEFEGKAIKIKTNIGTLKEVWNILKEINLDGLLTGDSLEISFTEMFDGLLLKGTLNNFLQAITDDLKTDAENLEIEDVVGIITLFFTSIARPFQDLNIAVTLPKAQ